jgi:hypothetical protein
MGSGSHIPHRCTQVMPGSSGGGLRRRMRGSGLSLIGLSRGGLGGLGGLGRAGRFGSGGSGGVGWAASARHKGRRSVAIRGTSAIMAAISGWESRYWSWLPKLAAPGTSRISQA